MASAWEDAGKASVTAVVARASPNCLYQGGGQLTNSGEGVSNAVISVDANTSFKDTYTRIPLDINVYMNVHTN